ncbi:hypothetical protein SLEP1_g46813 [Rubroshorea leprosula]|uniref:Uncharacterized protein n=1 Tax=Rubroshorea leprosula TaxID=152421 RepID=A0AAV5LR55_9ROSI|nr:hypothetical protein SLEP1_g46813 [Rubroshorea leprosula]
MKFELLPKKMKKSERKVKAPGVEPGCISSSNTGSPNGAAATVQIYIYCQPPPPAAPSIPFAAHLPYLLPPNNNSTPSPIRAAIGIEQQRQNRFTSALNQHCQQPVASPSLNRATAPNKATTSNRATSSTFLSFPVGRNSLSFSHRTEQPSNRATAPSFPSCT